jgi:endonuclease/exonuclease/phosphatase family metal-dependent hydrolase
MNKEDYCKFEDFLKEYQDLREIQDELRLVNNIGDEKKERIDSIMNYVDDKLNSPDRRDIIEWLRNLLPGLQLVEEMFLGDCINDLDNNNNLDDQEFDSHTNENSFFESSESSLSEYSHANSLDDQFLNFSEPLDAITKNFCGMIEDEISVQLKDIQDHIGQKGSRRKNPKEKNESILKYVNEEHNKNTIFLNILCRLQNSESRLELGIFKELQTWIYTIDEEKLNKIDEEKLHKLSKKKRAKDTIDEKKKKHIEELTKMEKWYISLKTAPAVIKTQKLSICTFNIKKFSKNNKGVCIDKKKCKNNLINCRCGFNKRRNIIAGIFKEEIKKRGLKAFDIIAIQEALSDAQSDDNYKPIEAIKGLVDALNEVCKPDNTYHYEITSQSIFDLEYGVFIYNQERLKCITISTGYPITEREIGLNGQLLETCFGSNDLTKNNIKEKLSESTNFRLPTYGLFQFRKSFKKILICSVHFKSIPSIELELIDDLIPYSPQKLYEEKQIYSVLCGDFNFKNRKSTLSNKHFCSGLDLQNNSTNLAHFFAGEKKCYDNIYFLNIKNYKTKIQRELSDMNSKIIIEDDEQKEELNKAFIFALNRNFFTKVEEEQIGRIMELVKLKEGFDRRERKCQQDEYEIRIKIADTIFEDKERRNQILNEIVGKSSIAMTAKVNRFKEQLEKIGSLDLFTIASFLFSDHLPVGVILDI